MSTLDNTSQDANAVQNGETSTGELDKLSNEEVAQVSQEAENQKPKEDPKVAGTIETPIGDAVTTPPKEADINTKKDESLDEPDPEKPDFFLTRMDAPNTDTGFLMSLYGKEGFGEFKDADDYWENDAIREQFVKAFGDDARYEFNHFYDAKKVEYSAFKLNMFKKSVSVYDTYRDNTDYLESGVKMQFNSAGQRFNIGDQTTNPLQDIRKAAKKFITVPKKQADGSVTFEEIEYTPEALEELEKDPTFTGLAYPDDMYSVGDNTPVNGLSLQATFDGQVYDPITKKFHDVRNDQVVSKWDLETGSFMDGILNNDKLEADSVMDYVKTIVRAPINMAVNMADTMAQLGRASISLGTTIENVFREDGDQLSVKENDAYKWLTARGIQLKGYNTSMSREAMNDGYFFSLEAFLQTTADVALQVALARGLGAAGAGLRGVFGTSGMSATEAAAAKQAWASFTGRFTLTAMSIKDSYNEAIANGYTESEASVITGAMAIAMWKANDLSDYIFENHDLKESRKLIHESLSKRLKRDWTNATKEGTRIAENSLKTKVKGKVGKELAKKEVEQKGKEKFAKRAMYNAESIVKSVLNKVKSLKGKGPDAEWFRSAQQEALEEMTEELYQDGVKHMASAYGVLINNALAAGKGRYSTIYDDGYFKDAVNRYITSGAAGGMGGPLGMALGGGYHKSSLTSSNSIAEIVAAGKTETLIDVLKDMRDNGELGPQDLSTKYNENLKIFEPIAQGKSQKSLGDMMYEQFLFDINHVNMWLNSGQFGNAIERFNNDPEFKDKIEAISMHKDFIANAGRLLDIHQLTGISTKVYSDLDAMTEQEFLEYLNGGSKEAAVKIKKLKDEREEIAKRLTEGEKTVENETEEEKQKREEGNKKDKETKIRLDREIESLNVTDSKIVEEMMDRYRRVRAMANGTASEYYFVQSLIAEDGTFGLRKYRDEKFKDLGDTPFVDHMMAIRNRSLLEEKKHAQKVKKSDEIEENIGSLTPGKPESIEAVAEILAANSDVINKATVSKLLKVVDNIDYAPISDALNPASVNSIFNPTEKGLTPEEFEAAKRQNMVDMFIDLAKKEPLNNTYFQAISGNYSDPTIVSLAQEFTSTKVDDIVKYFENVSQNPDEAKLPIIDIVADEDMMVFDVTIESSNRPFLDSLNGTKISERMPIPKEIVSARKSRQTLNNIKDYAFDKNDYTAYDPIVMFNKMAPTSRGMALSNMSLQNAVTSEINSTLEAVYGDIFTKTDTSNTDDLLKQIEFKRALSSIFETFLYGQSAAPLHGMLLKFRQNVVNILEDEYDPNDISKDPDTVSEDHAYKDYSMFSDIFTDYIYDPVKLERILTQDEALDTEEDRELRDDIDYKRSLFKVQALDNEGRMIDVPIYHEAAGLDMVRNALDAKYHQLSTPADIEAALDALNGQTLRIDENHSIILDGMTRLNLMEWLLKGVRGHIENAAGVGTPTAFIQEKRKSIKNDFDIFNKFIESFDGNSFEIKEMFEDEIPEYYTFIAEGMELKTDEHYINLAKLNIKIEQMLHKIYQGKMDLTKYSVDKDELFDSISDYLIKRVPKQENLAVLIGALTTDFTPFYSRFKSILEGKKPEDNMVIAAQENAAKYAAASVYSDEFNKIYNAILEKRVSGAVIYGSLIQGAAGTGKTTATTELGMSIGMDILGENGEANLILPVSNTKNQINRISKVVGSLKGDNEGLSSADLLNLLKRAVVENNQEAIDTLDTLGAVLIDEITYIPFVVAEEPKTGNDSYKDLRKLNSINDLIIEYNNKHRRGKNKLSLVMLGDTNQSGATTDVKGRVESLAIDPRRTAAFKYMDFSFRGRNNYLVDSVKAISKASTMEEMVSKELEQLDTSDGVVVPKGMKYGITKDTFYGINVVDSVDNTTTEYVKLLNDTELVSNIERKLEADPEFTVMVAPESLDTFTNSDSLLLKLYNAKDGDGNYKYRDNFILLNAEEVGGDEANYVIAEMPMMEAVNSVSAKILKDRFYTIATRSFDFVTIVNKSPKLKIQGEAKPERIDGQAIIPNNKVEGEIKEKLKQMQLAILSDIDGKSIDSDEGTDTTDTTDGDGNGDGDGGGTRLIAKDGEGMTTEIVLKPEELELVTQIMKDGAEGGPLAVINSTNVDLFGEPVNKRIAIKAYTDMVYALHGLFNTDITQEEIDNLLKVVNDNLEVLRKYVMDDVELAKIEKAVAYILQMSTIQNPDIIHYTGTILKNNVLKFEITNTPILLEDGSSTKLANFELVNGKSIFRLTDEFSELVKASGSTKAVQKYLDTRDIKLLEPFLGTFPPDVLAAFRQIIDGTFKNNNLTPAQVAILGDFLFNSIQLLPLTLDTDVVKKIQEGVKKKDIQLSDSYISELKYRMYEGSSDVLGKLFNQLKEGEGTLNIPPNARELVDSLFKNYSKESVLKALKHVTNEVLTAKQKITKASVDITKAHNLAALLGIQYDEKDFMKSLDEAKKIHDASVIRVNNGDYTAYRDLFVVSKFMETVSRLHANESGLAAQSYFYYNRTVPYYDLSDYISNFKNRFPDRTYTIKITPTELRYLKMNIGEQAYNYLNSETDRNNYLMIGKDADPNAANISDADKLEIVAVRDYKGTVMANGDYKMDLFVAAVDNTLGTKTIIAKLNTQHSNGEFTEQEITPFIKRFTEEMKAQNTQPKGVATVELAGKPLDLLNLRAGEVVSGPHIKIDELLAKSKVNASSNIFVVTDEKSNMKGKMYMIYSYGSSVDIDNELVKNGFRDTGKLPSNMFVNQEGGKGMSSNIGVLPVDLKIPFKVLVDRYDSSIRFSTTTSVMSLTMQKVFAEKILSHKVGDTMNDGKFTVTQKHLDAATLLSTEFDEYMNSKEAPERAAINSSITDAKNKIAADSDLDNVLEQLATTQVDTMSRDDLSDIEKNNTAILSLKTVKEYVLSDNGVNVLEDNTSSVTGRSLNINYILKSLSTFKTNSGKDSKVAVALDKLSEMTGFNVSPKLEGNGAREAVMGVVNEKFLSTYRDHVMVSAENINTPTIELTEDVKYQIVNGESVLDNNVNTELDDDARDTLDILMQFNELFNNEETQAEAVLYNRDNLNKAITEIDGLLTRYSKYYDLKENASEKVKLENLKKLSEERIKELNNFTLNHKENNLSYNDIVDKANNLTYSTTLEDLENYLEGDKDAVEGFAIDETNFLNKIIDGGQALESGILHHILTAYSGLDLETKEDLIGMGLDLDTFYDAIFEGMDRGSIKQKEIIEQIINGCY